VDRVSWPITPGFDPDDERHRAAAVRAVAARFGEGFAWERFDPADRKAWFTRKPAERAAGLAMDGGLTLGPDGTMRGKLAVSLRSPAAGKKAVAWYEDLHPGWTLTRFDPFLGDVELRRLSKGAVRCRGAVASVFRVQPYEIQVTELDAGGYQVSIPNSYQASRHAKKLQDQAAQVVGRPGWHARVDARAFTARILPGELPTFQSSYPPPAPRRRPRSWRDQLKVNAGVRLGDLGEPNRPLWLDLNTAPHTFLAGLTRSGKSAWINTLVSGLFENGFQVAACNTAMKEPDFTWFRDLARPGGYGHGSKAAILAVLNMVYAEATDRAQRFKTLGVNKWQELTDRDREALPPLFTLIDEAQQILTPASTMAKAKAMPDGKAKDDLIADIVLTGLIETRLVKLAAETAAMGVFLCVSTQYGTRDTGIAPAVKQNLGHRVLLGSRPSRLAKSAAFNDPDSVPEVPDWIQGDPRAALGVGVAELSGDTPCVFKGYHLSDDNQAYRRRLDPLGLPVTDQPEPTAAQIARYASLTGDEPDFGDDGPAGSVTPGAGWGAGPGGGLPRGAAKAAHQLRFEADLAAKAARDRAKRADG
jgi:hypothetical protein